MKFSRALLAAALILEAFQPSQAAPLEDCARRFIGPLDLANAAGPLPHRIFRADRKVTACVRCVPDQNWWCNGNTLTLNHIGASFAWPMTLSADGNELTGGFGRAVRARG